MPTKNQKKENLSEMNLSGDEDNLNFTDETDKPDESDEKIKDAEILSETKFDKPVDAEELEEFISDDFSQFLLNLPSDTEASFVVSRLPDRNLKGEFRQACNVFQKKTVIYWNGETAPDEIYSQVVEQFGGGKYMFQIRQNQRLGKAWTEVLGDPPHLTEIEKALIAEKQQTHQLEQAKTFTPNQDFTANPSNEKQSNNSIKDLIGQIKDVKELQEILNPPPQTAAPATNSNADIKPQTKAEIALEFYSRAVDDNAKTKIINSIFGTASSEVLETEEKGFIAETFEYVVHNPSNTITAIQTIFGGLASIFAPLLQSRQTAAAPNFAPAQNNAPAAFNLDALRNVQPDAQPAQQPENASQAAQSEKNGIVQTESSQALTVIPSIRLED